MPSQKCLSGGSQRLMSHCQWMGATARHACRFSVALLSFPYHRGSLHRNINSCRASSVSFQKQVGGSLCAYRLPRCVWVCVCVCGGGQRCECVHFKDCFALGAVRSRGSEAALESELSGRLVGATTTKQASVLVVQVSKSTADEVRGTCSACRYGYQRVHIARWSTLAALSCIAQTVGWTP